MKRLEYTFDNLGGVGIIKDDPEEGLPENAWTDGQNVRFSENAVEKFNGHDQVYGETTASSGPLFALQVKKESNLYWMYADENHIMGTDGSTHEDMSSGTYNATLDVNWNGGTLANGIVVLNNGYDTPQQWTGSALTDNFTDLSNWPAGMVARVVRAREQVLIAADIDDGSGRDGTLLRWSHPATPGSVPSTWDYDDTTHAAGRTVIPEGGDYILDIIKLRDMMVVYKESMCFRMAWIGGRAVFKFPKLFDHIGLLSRRCAKEFFGKHFCVTNDDVIIHDGQTVIPVLKDRWQKYLFQVIDSTNYQRTFVVANYRRKEIWICYPEAGYALPNMALVWNWGDNTVGVRELPPGCAHIAYGVIDPSVGGTFQDLSGTFANQTQAFDDQNYSGAKQGMFMCSYDKNAFYRADQTNQFDGQDIQAFVQRSYLPLGNITKAGKMIYDPSRWKTVYEIWPVFDADPGTVVEISVGARSQDNSSISWEKKQFVVGVDRRATFRKGGRIIDIKYSMNGNKNCKLLRYKIVFTLAKGTR